MKIREISKETGLSTSTIRYYEQQNLIRGVERDKNGIRNFSEDDKKWIKFLSSVKRAGLSLEQMMHYAELFYSKNESIPQRLEVTKQCRESLIEKMNEIKKGIEFLDHKIDYYNEKIYRKNKK
ncbi:MerR family transcriptional regulator [Oceanirhabdus sp. W0125-5]|uniref:MerR family transcriptional regulator n=1 Tax=Oceanirhabdus sp. W0125-5 TaxID=2999116 RepID=UPI0022F2A536|nr:MerR family transcriptional regulator [Oceanirhabdus sp. W0125-5]WBW96687.1 MerR family transcriptional regulator [Oceanirhabdus sp. W0125-5]